MGKDSEYYKEKKRTQVMRLRELLSECPEFVSGFIYDKELTSQTSTLIMYTYDIMTFLRFELQSSSHFKGRDMKDIKIEELAKLNSKDIVEYQHFLEYNSDPDERHENDKKAISRKFSALRGLFKYHLEHGNIQNNPMALVKMPKIKKDKNIVRMNNQEVVDLLTIVERGFEKMSDRQRKFLEKTKQRDIAIMTLMLGTGIRVSECVGLDINDVDLKANTLTIVRKGGGQDILYFNDEINEKLSEYINGERALIIAENGHEDALFYSLQKKRISVDAVEKLVKKFSLPVSGGKKITPHKLRSTYGTALYRSTGDIRLVADVLGHENINTTIDYYAAIEDEHKQQAADAVRYKKTESYKADKK